MNGNLWFVQYYGGNYWATPNYIGDRLHDWSLVQFQNGAMMPAPIRVAQNALIFIKTAIQLPPLAGPQPKEWQLGL